MIRDPSTSFSIFCFSINEIKTGINMMRTENKYTQAGHEQTYVFSNSAQPGQLHFNFGMLVNI